jgi:hypothetical protein
MIHSTVSTLHVRCGDQRRVQEALAGLGRSGAVVGPVAGKWITVYDPRCLYDDEERARLAAVLSAALDAPTLIVTLLKYGQLQLELWRDGRREIDYQLDLDHIRGEPSPEKCDRAAAGVASQLLPLCQPGTEAGSLDRLLRALQVSSGRMELDPSVPADRERLRAMFVPLVVRRDAMARATAAHLVQASHEAIRRDLSALAALPDDKLLAAVERLRDANEALRAAAQGRLDEAGARHWRSDHEECLAWLKTGADGIRSGMRRKLDALAAQTEREIDELIDLDRMFARWNHDDLARQRDAAAAFAASPRPLRADSVLDVWADLSRLLELQYAFSLEEAVASAPGYPGGYVQVEELRS